MNTQSFQSILSACEQCLSDAKSGDEKSFLFSATSNLKYSLHIAHSEKFVKTNRKNIPQVVEGKKSLPEAVEKYATSSTEISLLGQAAKRLLLFEVKSSPSSRNTKSIKSLLELFSLLLSSGTIPTGLNSTISSVEVDGSNVGSAFLSKLLGPPAQKQFKNSCQLSENDAENVFTGLVDSIITAAESLESKLIPDRAQESLLYALTACIAPHMHRKEILTTELECGGLILNGGKLCKIFELTLSLVVSPSVSSGAVQSCFRTIGKATAASLEGSFQSGAEGDNLPLENDVVTMATLAADLLDKLMVSKTATVDQQEHLRIVMCALLNFFLHLIEKNIIMKRGSALISCFRNRVLPSTLRTTRHLNTEVFQLSVRLSQYFCSSTGAYKRLFCGSLVFSEVYLRFLPSVRCSEVQKIHLCKALRAHLKDPFDMIHLFLHRSTSFSSGLLESVIDELCAFCGTEKVSPDVSQMSKTGDCMGILSTSHPEYISSFAVSRIYSRSSDLLKQEALLTLFAFLSSASQWLTTTKAQNSQVTEEVKSGALHCTKLFKRMRSIKEIYSEFLYIFNQLKKPFEAISLVTTSFPPRCCCEQMKGKNGDSVVETYCGEDCLIRQQAYVLKESDGNIDRIILGEYFSKCLRDTHAQNVFKAWIDLHDFKGFGIDEALRIFLGGFKLVGEAQVVDKTMELFSEHYYSQNEDSFPSMDAAFVLSFSICMLNTDAHSPHVKNKMKLDEFVQNNRGIDNGNDIDTAILQGVYERISQSEIVLRSNLQTPSVAFLERVIAMEGWNVSATVEELTEKLKYEKDAGENNCSFDPNFLEIIWDSTAKKICYTFVCCLASVLRASETSSDSAVGDPIKKYMDNAENRYHYNCLRSGFMHMIRLCSHFGLYDETVWLMEYLFAFSNLSQAIIFRSGQVEMRGLISPLRLELLTTTLNLFRVYGNYFPPRCWEIGYCALSLLDAVANGVEGLWRRQARAVTSDASALPKALPPDMWFGDLSAIPSSITGTSVSIRAVTLTNLRAVPASAIDTWLEHLFDVTRFSDIAKLSLSQGLIRCCGMELRQERCFSLNKLLEFITVCESTVNDIQLLELWKSSSEVFVQAGLMHPSIAIPAVEDLLVIILGFLLREDGKRISAQKMGLLQPLDDIFSQTAYPETQLKVLSLLQDVVQRGSCVLQEGWRNVFSCLLRSASTQHCCASGWNMIMRIAHYHIGSVAEYLGDFINCIGTFLVAQPDENMGLQCISVLVAVARWLHFGVFESFEVENPSAIARWGIEKTVEAVPHVSNLEQGLTVGRKSKGELWEATFRNVIGGLSRESPRIRAHTVASVWCLFECYGAALDQSTRAALLCDYLAPCMKQVFEGVPQPGNTNFDRIDYRILVQLATKGLLSAATSFTEEDVSRQVCELFQGILESVSLEEELIRNDFVDVIIGVLRDILPNNGFYNEVEENLRKVAGRWVGLCRSSALDCLNDHPYFSRWALDYKRTEQFDLFTSKRTEDWEELHHTPAATNSLLVHAPVLSKEKKNALISIAKNCVLNALREALIKKLREKLRQGFDNSESSSTELYVNSLRQTLLACCEYTVITKDLCGLETLQLELESIVGKNVHLGVTQELIMIPLAVMMAELVVLCRPSLGTLPPTGTIWTQIMEGFMEELIHSRGVCMESQREGYLLSARQQHRHDDGASLSTQAQEFYAFTSVFRMYRSNSSNKDEKDLDRIYHEKNYLLRVFGLKLLLSLQPTSALLLCIPLEVQLDLVAELPSVLEETVSTSFFKRCWSTLGLSGDLPSSFVLVEWVQLAKATTHPRQGSHDARTPSQSRERTSLPETGHWDPERSPVILSSQNLLEDPGCSEHEEGKVDQRNSVDLENDSASVDGFSVEGEIAETTGSYRNY